MFQSGLGKNAGAYFAISVGIAKDEALAQTPAWRQGRTVSLELSSPMIEFSQPTFSLLMSECSRN